MHMIVSKSNHVILWASFHFKMLIDAHSTPYPTTVSGVGGVSELPLSLPEWVGLVVACLVPFVNPFVRLSPCGAVPMPLACFPVPCSVEATMASGADLELDFGGLGGGGEVEGGQGRTRRGGDLKAEALEGGEGA